jgi:hypothetical protein
MQAKVVASISLTPCNLRVALAELDPGGRPSTTVDSGSGLSVVCTAPLPSVRRTTATVGAGVTSGREVTVNFWVTPFWTPTISGEYVDVARSFIATTEVGTEVLKM